MVELTQEFGFDAAHYMPFKAEGHEYRRMHGHSFYAEVTLRGEIDPATGWLRDLGEVKATLEAVRETLDHRLLNEIAGPGKSDAGKPGALYLRSGKSAAAGGRARQIAPAVLRPDLRLRGLIMAPSKPKSRAKPKVRTVRVTQLGRTVGDAGLAG